MELSVVIPTRDRRAILREVLRRLEAQTGGVQFEVVVVDDGSRDGTRDAVRDWAAQSSLELQLLEHEGLGPAAAINRALAAARTPVCLFLNDDSWARPDLVVRHRDFHLRDPAPEAALLGAIVLPSDPPPTPFMRWLAQLRFDYSGIENPHDVGGRRFYTTNVSAKTNFVRRVGGFDETFPYGYEDIDLGLRLEQHGLRLAYDEGAIVEHHHPIDLATATVTLRQFGRSLRFFVERHPEWPRPRRPGAQHRVKAGALTALAAVGARTPRLQRETWRFVCHEAFREGYWAAVDARPSDGVRIGRRLARVAAKDDDARLPADLSVAERLRFSIVIVTWQSAGELNGLLDSIARHVDESAEVVVVDNASTDDSAAIAEASPGVATVVRLEENRGFGVANNIGVRAAREDVVVLLNPDTLLVDASLERLAAAAEAAPAIYGPELLNLDGSRQPSASPKPGGWEVALSAVAPARLLPTPLRVRCEPSRANRTIDVGWLTGACLAARRDLLVDLGPFDETIELFGEDLDLGLRARRRGLRCVYAPGLARIVHLGGRSSAQRYPDGVVDLKVRRRREIVARQLGERRERYDFAAQVALFATRYTAKRALGVDAARDRQWLDAAWQARR